MASRLSSKESIYKGSDTTSLQECDVCRSQDITSEAVSFCTNCDEYLCTSCDKVHKGSGATRDHNLLRGSNLPPGSTRTKTTPDIMLCVKHKTMTLDIYCNTHDDVICTRCNITNHTKCDTVPVSQQTSKLNRVILQKVNKNMSDITNRVLILKQARKIDESKTKTQIQKCLRDLQKLRKNINDHFDKLEKEMADEIKITEEKVTKEIKRHITMVDDISHQIEKHKNYLSECQKIQDDDIMFVGMKKVSSRLRESEDVISNIEKNVYSIDLHLQPSDAATNVIQSFEAFGTILGYKQSGNDSNTSPSNMSVGYKQSNINNQTSVLNMSIVNKQKINVGSWYVFGCTFMCDGHLVLGCGDDGLKLFDKHFQYKSQLSVYSFDVSSINNTDVIITQGVGEYELTRIQVLPEMEKKKIMKMDRLCYGVDVFDDKIFVTCHDYTPGNGEVRVLNMDGQLQRKLPVDQHKSRLTRPDYVKVSRDGSKIFISDYNTDIITCLDQQGRVLYEYSDKDLTGPTGMYVDGEDNLLVCGYWSHKVHVVRQNGRKKKILLSSKDRVKKPYCISYRHSDGCLVVGKYDNNENTLIVFTTK